MAQTSLLRRLVHFVTGWASVVIVYSPALAFYVLLGNVAGLVAIVVISIIVLAFESALRHMRTHKWRPTVEGEVMEEQSICDECGLYASEGNQPCEGAE